MKKSLLCIITILLFYPALAMAREVLERAQITAIPAPLNVALTRPADETRWLLKLKSCPTLQAGQTIGLGGRGALNGYQDYLDLGLSRRCEIVKAFPFNEALTVNSTNRDRAVVTDEKDKTYDLFHDGRCGDLLNWVNQTIYADRAGPVLAKGARLFVPGEPKACAITFLEKVMWG